MSSDDPVPAESTTIDGLRISTIALDQSSNVAEDSKQAEFHETEGVGSEIEEEEDREDVKIYEEVGESSRAASGGTGGDVWVDNWERGEEAPVSPSSSGYVAERGSSSDGMSSGIEEVGVHDDDATRMGDPVAAWVPGKRHLDEDDASISWRKRKKHFFVLSYSGKPIFSSINQGMEMNTSWQASLQLYMPSYPLWKKVVTMPDLLGPVNTRWSFL